jgi:hypothetical protein
MAMRLSEGQGGSEAVENLAEIQHGFIIIFIIIERRQVAACFVAALLADIATAEHAVDLAGTLGAEAHIDPL